MSETRYLSELFDIQPPNWGLRGDPWFWQDMKISFAGTPFPYSSSELVADINRIFEEKTGEKLTNAARPYVEAYDHGGKTAVGELGLPVKSTGIMLPCGSTGRWTP